MGLLYTHEAYPLAWVGLVSFWGPSKDAQKPQLKHLTRLRWRPGAQTANSNT